MAVKSKTMSDGGLYNTRVSHLKKRHNTLKTERQPVIEMMQTIAYFVRGRRMDFNSSMTPGQFLTGQIWSSVATQAAHTAASTYVGQLFPTPDKTIRIDPPYALRALEDAETQEYFTEITRRVCRAFSLPTAGFSIAYDSHWLDRVIFGTSGMEVENTTDEDKYEIPVRFKAFDAKTACIAEGKNGYVDTIYKEYNLTVRQVVEEYGEEGVYGNKGVSAETRKKFDECKFDEKVVIVHVVEPRLDHSKYTFGNKDMPISSIHYEEATGHELRESGYEEMSTFVSRFWKDVNEVYGRSPASELLPEIITLDGFSELTIEAAEKLLGPPLVVFTDALAGGVFDNSANAINAAIDPTSMLQNVGGKIAEPVYTVGDMKPVYEEKARIEQAIYTGFSVDRLLDLNNDTRMTLGEANIRNELRGQSLSSVYSREISEVLYPLVRRVVHIMFAKGLLGVLEGSPEHAKLLDSGMVDEDILFIPEKVAKIIMRPNRDQEFFEVTFISPAARVLQQETILGIERTLEYAIRVQPIAPEVMDVINIDEVTRQIQHLTGAPAKLLRSPMEVAEIREERKAMQQKAMQLEAAKVEAETARAGGAAVQSVSKAAEGNGQPV